MSALSIATPIIWCIASVLIIAPYIVRLFVKRSKQLSKKKHRANQVRMRTMAIEESKDCCSCAPDISSALQRETTFARYLALVARTEYIAAQIAVGTIFYSFEYSKLSRNIATNNAYVFNIILHVIQLISIAVFLQTSLSDPAIIPKADIALNSDGTPNESTQLAHNYKHDFEPICIDPDDAPGAFCWRCKFVRPIRSKHDYDIDACVAVFDHYSTAIGNSIGAYNHRYFLLSTALESIIYVIAIYISIDLLILNTINQYPIIVGWIVWCLVLLCLMYNIRAPLMGLFFHLYLAVTNQTTYEMIKPRANEKFMKYFEELRPNNGRNNASHHSDGRISFDEGYLTNLMLFLRGIPSEK